MIDPLSTLFSAVQKETQREAIGDPAHERETYTALYGDGGAAPKRGRRVARAAAGVLIVVALVVAVYLIAPFG